MTPKQQEATEILGNTEERRVEHRHKRAKAAVFGRVGGQLASNLETLKPETEEEKTKIDSFFAKTFTTYMGQTYSYKRMLEGEHLRAAPVPGRFNEWYRIYSEARVLFLNASTRGLRG